MILTRKKANEIVKNYRHSDKNRKTPLIEKCEYCKVCDSGTRKVMAPMCGKLFTRCHWK